MARQKDGSILSAVLGATIKQLRLSEKMTQGDLADAIGLTRTAVTNMELGTAAVTLETLVHLAVRFDVKSWDDILPAISPRLLDSQNDAWALAIKKAYDELIVGE